MADRILLLGLERKTALALACALEQTGLEAIWSDWRGFSVRGFGRHERPKMILVDFDSVSVSGSDPDPASSAAAPAAFCLLIRKAWGENFPVLAVSERTRFAHIAELLDAGAADVLAPGAPAALVERKISKLLAGAAQPGTAAGLPDLAAEVPEELRGLLANGQLPRLGDLVTVCRGVAPRSNFWRRIAPPDAGWKGVLTGDAVRRFHVGRPEAYLSWNRLHLFRLPPAGEFSVPEKVLLCRAGPPIRAAVDRSRLPAGADMYSLIPREGVGAGYVACVLNSRMMDFYFNRLARLGRDGRLRAADIREAPVPPPNAAATAEFNRIATLLAHFGPNPQSWIDRQSRTELVERMEELVFGLYGAGTGAREALGAMCF